MSNSIEFEEDVGLKAIILKPVGGGYSRLHISQQDDGSLISFADGEGIQSDFDIMDNELGKLALSWVGLKYE